MLKQNKNITDEWLCAIGMHRPMSLTISQCHGDKVTVNGLRDLFRNCSDSLEVQYLHLLIVSLQSHSLYFCIFVYCMVAEKYPYPTSLEIPV